jgi:hypothetical protein
MVVFVCGSCAGKAEMSGSWHHRQDLLPTAYLTGSSPQELLSPKATTMFSLKIDTQVCPLTPTCTYAGACTHVYTHTHIFKTVICGHWAKGSRKGKPPIQEKQRAVEGAPGFSGLSKDQKLSKLPTKKKDGGVPRCEFYFIFFFILLIYNWNIFGFQDRVSLCM